MDSSREIRGEHALRQGESDRLGFSEVADRIAVSIIDRASKDGLVIGLDGQWGSGKSSLLHLIERTLGKLPEGKRPTIINFRPWLVGNRDALLTSLFNELADKIASVALAQGDATKDSNRKAKNAAKAVRQFARSLSKAGELVETAGAWSKKFEWGGKALKGIGTMLGGEDKPTDLAGLKEKIVNDLKALDHRFIITVDDVDRLEPAEVIEVLRLVRSVADFPNIIYVLCYDVERLAEAIQHGAGVKDGAAFLEKIVQLTVMVPKPEPFELRNWFAEDLDDLLGTVSEEVRLRLKTIIDQEGGAQLKTPRSVVRTLDSIRFLWPAVRDEKLDVADLIWLQLIKDGAPALYRWIETYVASVAATSFGTATVSDGGKEARLKTLLESADEGHFRDMMYRNMFADQLPGVEMEFGDDNDAFKIYQKVSARDRQSAIAARRLASPDHYRLYFSLTGPTHAITQAGFDRFWQAADTNSDDTSAVLLSLHAQASVGALRKSDVLFERLRAMDAELWTNERAKNVILALGQMMDDAYRQSPDEGNFIVSNWDRAERLLPILFGPLDGTERAAISKQLFEQGAAIGWLTSIIRSETFAHGKYGDQKKPPETWLLSEPEFEQACEVMLARYRAMTIAQLLSMPRPIQILFAWKQAGDEEGPRKLLAGATVSDAGLLEALDAFASRIDSSDRGRYTVLKRDNVEAFMDYDAVLNHLADIAKNGEAGLRDHAKRLLTQANDARDW